MTIPNDLEQRQWVDVASVNPSFVTRLRPAMVGFLAFQRNREACFIGTGFVIAGNSQAAFVITAKHVIQEGVMRVQNPDSGRAATNPFVIACSITPSINPHKLKVVWMGAAHAAMLNVIHVDYNESLDIALCLVTPQDKWSDPFAPISIPLDITIPAVGNAIHMISSDRLIVSEFAEPHNGSGTGHVLKLEKRVSIRVGTVTGVFPKGLRQYKWPCFTTSIPAEPGMSGGFITIPRPNGTISACGVISADGSGDAARSNFHEAGESIIASAWPALCLQAPRSIPITPETKKHSLYDMMLAGDMDKAVGGIERIKIADHGNDVQTIALLD